MCPIWFGCLDGGGSGFLRNGFGCGGELGRLYSAIYYIIPPRMALSMEMDKDSKVLDIDGTLDVSNWLKNKILGFSKVTGLSMNRHENLCIAYL